MTTSQFPTAAEVFCGRTIEEQGLDRLERFLRLTRQYARRTSAEAIARAAAQAADEVWGHRRVAAALLSEITTSARRRVSGHGTGSKSQRILEARVAELV